MIFFAGDGAAYLTDTEDAGLSAITVNGNKKYINITNANVAEFAQDALEYAKKEKLTADATKTASDTTVTFENLDLGYYLVYPQGATDIIETYASICSLTSTTPDATVKVKAEYPEIEKVDDKVSAAWGETVNYVITGKVPDTTGYTTYTYEITDTMSDGLTFNQDSIKIFVDGTELTENYTVSGKSDRGFTLTIDVMKLQDSAGKEIKVTYSATVNENAVTKVEKNNAVLKYSNNPDNNESFTTTPPDGEEVYSLGIVIDKINGKGEKLEGAKFVLKNAEEKYYKLADGVVSWVDSVDDATEVTTDKNGQAKFEGLAEGTYFLVETEAPAGYNKLTSPTPVDVKPTTSESITSYSVTAQITNNTGSELPETGGMGTTLFYLVGGFLMMASVVLLVTKKRMSFVA